MPYLTELNVDELKSNFELANEHLKEVFSKYPRPRDMVGCPCCVSEYHRKSLNQGDLSDYLWKAILLGEEKRILSIISLGCFHLFIWKKM